MIKFNPFALSYSLPLLILSFPANLRPPFLSFSFYAGLICSHSCCVPMIVMAMHSQKTVFYSATPKHLALTIFLPPLLWCSLGLRRGGTKVSLKTQQLWVSVLTSHGPLQKTSFLTKPESSTGLCLNASLKRQFYLLSIQFYHLSIQSSGLSTRACDLPSHSSDQFYSPRTKGPIGKQSGGQCCTSGHILCDKLIVSRIHSVGGWCWLFPPAAAPHFWFSGCSSTRSTVSCSVPALLLCTPYPSHVVLQQ